MTFSRTAFATLLGVWLGACGLGPPPDPRPIDCESDRAAERYPEMCAGDAGADAGDDLGDDAGEESGGEDE